MLGNFFFVFLLLFYTVTEFFLHGLRPERQIGAKVTLCKAQVLTGVHLGREGRAVLPGRSENFWEERTFELGLEGEASGF